MMSSIALRLHRYAAVPGAERRLQRVAHGHVGLDRDHVGPGRHHLAGHGVAEVDDGVDEGPLVVLDDLLLVRHVGHGLELGVGDVGAGQALFVAAGTDDELASPISTDESQRMGGKRIERADERRAEEGGPVGVLHRPVLGHRLEEDEDDHDFEHDAQQHAQATEEVLGHDADQGGRDQLADEHQQQMGLRKLAGFSTRRASWRAPRLLLVDQRLGLDPVHADEAGLGHGEHPGGGEQRRDDDDEDDVLGVEADVARRVSTLRLRGCTR